MAGFILFGILVLLLIYVFFLMVSALTGAPFIRTSTRRLGIALSYLQGTHAQLVAELGSGDGKVAIVLARVGFCVHGYEINPFLVWWSRWRISRSKLDPMAKIYCLDFWRVDLAKYDAVFIYGIPHIMDRVSQKLKHELLPGAVVISCGFALPGWKPHDCRDGVYFYKKEGGS